MSSNSIRVGAEIFDSAREEGKLMSRSAAQQIEHWARIGAALEACGLTVGQVALLLKSQTEEQGDARLWAFKRQRQQGDLENARSGRATQDHLSWFSGGKARNLKLINSPY
ncbi:TA system antitoxin ParD family protein [Variovorax sp. RT4R15]|uniref:TA system antitoxin ParD family protein n=1 Tax=Variovorax sp. RT4R15 TaxID=3443737 RepID=UPI003F44681F